MILKLPSPGHCLVADVPGSWGSPLMPQCCVLCDVRKAPGSSVLAICWLSSYLDCEHQFKLLHGTCGVSSDFSTKRILFLFLTHMRNQKEEP